MDTSCKSESQKIPRSLAIKELINGFRFGRGMQSVCLLAQSLFRSITHTAEQDPNQNTVWFELLSEGLPLPDMGLSTQLTFAKFAYP